MLFFKRFSTFQIIAIIVAFSLTFIYLYTSASNKKYQTQFRFNGLLTRISKGNIIQTSILTKNTDAASSSILGTTNVIKQTPASSLSLSKTTTTTTTTTKPKTSKTKPKTSTKPRIPSDRLGVVSYIPNSVSHVHQFILFLQGSWRYVIEHREEIFGTDGKKVKDINAIDLLSFCHPKICPEMKHVCVHIKNIKDIGVNSSKQTCYAIEQPFETDIPYTPLNSYIMFNRSDIWGLSSRYKYLLRTDNDVFITPALFLLKPNNLLFGQGGYSTEFNNKRLEEVAKRLGMVHRGVHSIGSTWCGPTDLLSKAGKKAIEVTRYIFLNEFNTSSPEIARFFKTNIEGEWPEWWRPVSSMYGGDLTLNHLIKDISQKNKYDFDATSCETKSIWKAPHIHCWHSDCKFSKFKFQSYLNSILSGTGTLGGDIFHEFVENTYSRNVTKMSLQQFSTFIAWNSIGKYLRDWVL